MRKLTSRFSLQVSAIFSFKRPNDIDGISGGGTAKILHRVALPLFRAADVLRSLPVNRSERYNRCPAASTRLVPDCECSNTPFLLGCLTEGESASVRLYCEWPNTNSLRIHLDSLLTPRIPLAPSTTPNLKRALHYPQPRSFETNEMEGQWSPS
jgi:hypothetical protein